LDKLLSHPLLEGGQVLEEAETVLVSLAGGPDLTMAEVNRVMEELNRQCGQAQVILGAALDESLRERLAVTVVAMRRPDHAANRSRGLQQTERLDTQLLDRTTLRPDSRFLPPAPELSPEKIGEVLAQQRSGGRGRKSALRMRQTHLPLEIVSKGRFDKSEPTIHKGEDLDVPTYIRRGVALN